MIRRYLTLLVVLLVGVGVVGRVVAQEEEQQRILFIAENDEGKVWANISLTIQRTTEPYLPMVVAIENKKTKNITVDRTSLWLTDLNGVVYTMPTVKEVRKSYDKSVIDYRMVSYAGIPWEGWRWNRRLEPANFFPDLRAQRGSTTRDRITLRQRHAMVNLLYFERLRNFELGKPFFLDVQPKGWETGIRLRIIIS